ncbi:MAG: DUF6159 family protein [Thermoplasmata archaeon]
MGRFSRGLQLIKLSFGVIKKDKEILLFPVISGIAIIAIALSFIVPFIFFGAFSSTGELDIVFAVFWVAFYFVSFFITIFFNVAIVGCALMRLDGGDPTFGYGIKYALERVRYILLWTLVAATIGLILRAISERSGLIGKIVIGFIGLAWSIATYFVIPVIAAEKLTPFQALKRSVSILRSSWGEALVSNLGIGLIFGLLALLGVLIVILGFAVGGIIGGIICLMIAVIYWVFLAVLQTAVSGVLMAALYRFATTGKTSEDFPAHVLSNPWTL